MNVEKDTRFLRHMCERVERGTEVKQTHTFCMHARTRERTVSKIVCPFLPELYLNSLITESKYPMSMSMSTTV